MNLRNTNTKHNRKHLPNKKGGVNLCQKKAKQPSEKRAVPLNVKVSIRQMRSYTSIMLFLEKK